MAGFYDYATGGTKSLWPGLSQFAKGNRAVPLQDAVDRILYRQAIETLRCPDEGVLNTELRPISAASSRKLADRNWPASFRPRVVRIGR